MSFSICQSQRFVCPGMRASRPISFVAQAPRTNARLIADAVGALLRARGFISDGMPEPAAQAAEPVSASMTAALASLAAQARPEWRSPAAAARNGRRGGVMVSVDHTGSERRDRPGCSVRR